MAYIVNKDDCINCGACEAECPNNAIYEGGMDWSMGEGTKITGSYIVEGGEEVEADHRNEPISDDFFFLLPDKCTECKGFHDEHQCALVCPVDCCLPDPDREEAEHVLLERQAKLH